MGIDFDILGDYFINNPSLCIFTVHPAIEHLLNPLLDFFLSGDFKVVDNSNFFFLLGSALSSTFFFNLGSRLNTVYNNASVNSVLVCFKEDPLLIQ